MYSGKVIIQAKSPGEKTFKTLVYHRVVVRKSLDEICHSIEVELPVSERKKVHKHDTVEVRYSHLGLSAGEPNYKQRLVTTVYVDGVADTTGESHNRITVTGRSPARDIIDSTWEGDILGSPTLEDIVKEIAGKFGIKVTRMPTNGRETGTIDSFSWTDESPWTKLIIACDSKGYILTSNQAGNLYIWEVAKGVRGEGFRLTEGLNIKRINYSENGAEQFHEYIAKGGFGESQKVVDDTCKNKRVLTINMTDSAISEEDLKRRAQTEMLRRKQKRIQVTVSGWGLTDEQIRKLGNTSGKEIFWEPNFLIPVNISGAGVSDKLLTAEIECVADSTTLESTITLVNREVYT
ncbi:hypothetical protein FACS189494_05220 [Spirochaetia bacterium]|nr:hypothetical protein FACS189494_05220 [Spirochaetia bacterium]